MQPAGLQIDQAPPLSVPLRFFVTAPIFLVLAALVLLWHGPEVLSSRWTPAALALTHLFTIGFMSMVMVGAMMQLLPVLAGAPMARPRAVAAVTHPCLVLGTLALASGFLLAAPLLLIVGTVALAVGFAVFLGAVAVALWRSRASCAALRALLLPVLGLVATVALGVTLGSGLGWGLGLANASIRDLHPGWGLLGWGGLLAIGVAYRVVPMFQITPRYPAAMTKWLAGGVVLGLALWSIALWLGDGAWGPFAVACAVALAAAYAAFAATTIALQQRRRRRVPDATLAFWRIGMVCLLAASVGWAIRVVWPAKFPEAGDVLIGVLALVGCAGSIIHGMLCKIAPFLTWFHLQAKTGAGRALPNMKKMLAHSDQQWQLRAHVAALALLAAAATWPDVLVYPAAFALGASAAVLEVNLVKVLRFVPAWSGRSPADRRGVPMPGISTGHAETRSGTSGESAA